MSSVSAVSLASQSGLQQLMQLQARRNADQAEQNARALQQEASNARRVADQADESARNLSVQSEQAQDRAGQARQGVAALNAEKKPFEAVSRVVEQAVVPAASAAVAAEPAASAVASVESTVNSQNQVTGTIINTTA